MEPNTMEENLSLNNHIGRTSTTTRKLLKSVNAIMIEIGKDSNLQDIECDHLHIEAKEIDTRETATKGNYTTGTTGMIDTRTKGAKGFMTHIILPVQDLMTHT